MWNYASEIVRTNPGTTVKIKTKAVGDDLKFKRFYLCWGALKKGFLDHNHITRFTNQSLILHLLQLHIVKQHTTTTHIVKQHKHHSSLPELSPPFTE